MKRVLLKIIKVIVSRYTFQFFNLEFSVRDQNSFCTAFIIIIFISFLFGQEGYCVLICFRVQKLSEAINDRTVMHLLAGPHLKEAVLTTFRSSLKLGSYASWADAKSPAFLSTKTVASGPAVRVPAGNMVKGRAKNR